MAIHRKRLTVALESETVQSIARFQETENNAVQIPVQQASESAGTELQEHEKKPTFVGSVESLHIGATAGLPKRGLEPPLRLNRTRT